MKEWFKVCLPPTFYFIVFLLLLLRLLHLALLRVGDSHLNIIHLCYGPSESLNSTNQPTNSTNEPTNYKQQRSQKFKVYVFHIVMLDFVNYKVLYIHTRAQKKRERERERLMYIKRRGRG